MLSAQNGKQTNLNFFDKNIARLGIEDDVICVNPSAFLKQLVKLLETENANINKTIKLFVDGVHQSIVDNDKRLLTSLNPLQTKKGSLANESFFKLLLKVDLIQTQIINLLISKLCLLAKSDYSSFNANENIPKLIIQQLCWMDHIIDPCSLTEKLIDVVQNFASFSLQVDIITLLPEIIEDSQHRDIVASLNELMGQAPELTNSIMDTFCTLDLNEHTLAFITSDITSRLDSIDIDALPIVLKFLFQTCVPSNASETVSAIRGKIDLDSFMDIKKGKISVASESIIIDTIRSAIRQQKYISDAWFKAISEICHYTSLDLYIFFIMYGLSAASKKKVLTTFMKKVQNQVITSKYLSECVSKHKDSMRDYFPFILSLSDYCLEYNDPKATMIAETLYSTCFQQFDIICRQEIIGSLVTHIGSGESIEVNRSLTILHSIVRQNTRLASPFTIFIKNLLDCVDTFEIKNVRLLFQVLVIIASSNVTSNSFAVEFDIFLKKKISSSFDAQRKIGIIGMCILLIQQNDLSVSNAVSTLDTLLSYCNKSETDMLMLFDELSQSIRYDPNSGMKAISSVDEVQQQQKYVFDTAQKLNLRPEIYNVFTDKIFELMENFLQVEAEPLEEGVEALTSKYHNFSEVADTASIILFPNTRELHYLPALFRLIRIVEKKKSGNLESYGLLSDSAVIMSSSLALSGLSAREKKDVIDGLYNCVNWYRELINAFCIENPEEYAVLCWKRLEACQWAEEMLVKCLGMSGVLWRVHGDLDDDEAIVDNGSNEESHTMEEIEPHVSDKDHYGSDEDNEREVSVAPASKASKRATRGKNGTKKSSKSKKSLKMFITNATQLAPHLRPFDIDVFTLLKLDITNKDQDEIFQVRLYLLKELSMYIKKNMIPNSYMASVVETLCIIFEMYGALFPKLEDESSEEFESISEPCLDCFTVLLECFNSLFLANAFSEHPSENIILHNILITIVQRGIVTAKTDELSFISVLNGAFDYFNHYTQMRFASLENSIVLVQILNSISGLSDDITKQSLRSKISKIASSYIQIEWNDTKAIKPELISQLITFHVSYANNSTDLCSEYIEGYLGALRDQNVEILEKIPLLNRETVPLFYKVLFEELIQHTKNANEFRIKDLEQSANDFSSLIGYVPFFEQKKTIISQALKFGKRYVDVFGKLLIPQLGRIFKFESERVVMLLKRFQTGTKMLQVICNHTKVAQDTALLSSVPGLKKSMEMILFNVKRLLQENRSLNAFRMVSYLLGSLKHKSLAGEVVGSQMPVVEEHETMDEEVSEVEAITVQSSKKHKKTKPESTKRKKIKCKKIKHAGTKSMEHEGNDTLNIFSDSDTQNSVHSKTNKGTHSFEQIKREEIVDDSEEEESVRKKLNSSNSMILSEAYDDAEEEDDDEEAVVDKEEVVHDEEEETYKRRFSKKKSVNENEEIENNGVDRGYNEKEFVRNVAGISRSRVSSSEDEDESTHDSELDSPHTKRQKQQKICRMSMSVPPRRRSNVNSQFIPLIKSKSKQY